MALLQSNNGSVPAHAAAPTSDVSEPAQVFRQVPPLVIDLDGTLLRSDLLVETMLLYVRDRPYGVLSLLQWWAHGKAALKQALAAVTDVDVTALPYDGALCEFIAQERRSGRRVILATASHRLLAERVAAHLALFDEVIATDGELNLSAHAKRDLLVERFGERGFDYAGNAAADLPVWKSARQAFVVNARPGVERQARALNNVANVMPSTGSSLSDWAQALRLHQWLKNLLVFVPLLASHRYAEWPLLTDAVLSFIAFGLCASSVYLLNDLLDLREDRHHPRKRARPFASGRLPILAGVVASPLLLMAAFLLSLWQLPANFTAVLAAYYVLTLAYSFWLKRRMVIDVIVLAALYTLRIIAGAVAIGLALSFWLLAFSMFVFLSLALVKRYSELYHVRARGDSKALGRGYFAHDLSMIASLGAAAGYMAVMVLALYINDPRTAEMYREPRFIWLACPLLLTWISRVWMLAHRGAMHDDPLMFAVRDRVSLLIGALLALVFWAAA
jgi:4-hydroxybenzoate polyprenyltransferase/phosphoserine phosphatase